MIDTQSRTTSDMITDLSENEIFVFGSNRSGIHGAGAARLAACKWGAEPRNPEGLQGQTYAIPTKDFNVYDTLTIPEIKEYVDRFLEFAFENEGLTFLVTEIGCGLAGLKQEDVGPLFEKAKHLNNIHLPKKFWDAIV